MAKTSFLKAIWEGASKGARTAAKESGWAGWGARHPKIARAAINNTTWFAQRRTLNFAGRATSGVVRGVGRVAANPAVYIPVVAGAGMAGFARGFGGQIMKDPVSFAWAMNANENGGSFNGRNALGTPLGVYNENPNYMVSPWRLPPSDPLRAGGELMLATFATRHGR
jgi:hypothetical protein